MPDVARPTTPRPRWITALIYSGAGIFIVALVWSAVLDPTIRWLHFFQIFIYIAVLWLSRRDSAWGYGAGAVIATFWNAVNLFVTHFIKAGWDQLVLGLTTGHMPRPDLFIGVVAGTGHALLIVGCLAAFLRTRPGGRAWAQFAGGGAISVVYLILDIMLTGRQFIALLHRVFHI